MSSEGAPPIERVLAACRADAVEQLEEVLAEGNQINFNTTDAVGNTALHLAAKSFSLDCLEILLRQDGITVDKVNIIEGNTPLHIAALNIKDVSISEAIIAALLQAGSNPKLLNKEGRKPLDLISPHQQDLQPIRNLLLNANLNIDLEVEDEDSDDEGASSE